MTITRTNSGKCSRTFCSKCQTPNGPCPSSKIAARPSANKPDRPAGEDAEAVKRILVELPFPKRGMPLNAIAFPRLEIEHNLVHVAVVCGRARELKDVSVFVKDHRMRAQRPTYQDAVAECPQRRPPSLINGPFFAYNDVATLVHQATDSRLSLQMLGRGHGSTGHRFEADVTIPRLEAT